MTTYFRYSDPRYNDIYEIYVNHDGTFHSALRSVDTLGRDPIYYDCIDDLPAHHRNEIVDMISERQKKANGN